MYIDLENKTIYSNLNNNVIHYFSITGNEIAEINRDLPTIEQDNELIIDISDITQNEKNAGLNALLNAFNQEKLSAYERNIKSDDLESRKYIKLARLKNIKDSKLSEFSYNDKTYQIDENSKVNLNGKVSAILLSQQAGTPIERVSWIAKDNSITEFTTVQFLEFTNAVAQYIERVLFVNDTIRSNINKANSIKALEAISIDITI